MHTDIAEIQDRLKSHGYIAEREIAIAIHWAQALGRPLLVEDPAGVGKTKIAKVMAQVLAAELIRLQCYAISVLLKHHEDQKRFKSVWLPALLEVFKGVEDGQEELWLEQVWNTLEAKE